MNLMNKRKILLLAAIAVLLLAGVSGTVAYIVVHTDPVVNTFQSTYVTVEVQNNKTIKNTSNIDAYIRAAVVATWQDSDGKVYAEVPNVKLNAESGWEMNGNFYYYKEKVASGDTTVTPVVTVNTADVGEPPFEQYSLHIEILAQAIQAEPTNVVTEEWGYTPPAANN